MPPPPSGHELPPPPGPGDEVPPRGRGRGGRRDDALVAAHGPLLEEVRQQNPGRQALGTAQQVRDGVVAPLWRRRRRRGGGGWGERRGIVGKRGGARADCQRPNSNEKIDRKVFCISYELVVCVRELCIVCIYTTSRSPRHTSYYFIPIGFRGGGKLEYRWFLSRMHTLSS